MGACAIALSAAIGLAVDMGHMYVAKNETQAFCDAAAVAAALKLNGTLGGITNAQNAVANSSNTWNFSTTAITNYTVSFATDSTSTFSTTPTTGTNYKYARVQATVSVPLYFLPIVVTNTSSNVVSSATAAQIARTSFTSQGLAPFSVVSVDTTSPNFGLTVGSDYNIQWPQYNGTRSGCNANGGVDNCFNRPPACSDSLASKQAVVSYWNSSTNGYWGDNSASVLTGEVLNTVQSQPVSIGQSIFMSNGNKAVEGPTLDTRANQDGNRADNSINPYLSSSTHNGRRLIAIPVVKPSASGTIVIGFASFLLYTNNSSSSSFYQAYNGNEGFCAMYAGPYVQGSTDPGGSSQGGAYQVKLVL